MVERIVYASEKYALNDSFELLYGPRLSRRLLPCEEIKDGDVLVSVVHNNSINPCKFTISEKHRDPIHVSIPKSDEKVTLDYPGISGILTLDDELNRNLLERYVTEFMGGKYDRRDHLHHAKISSINQAGWKVFWAPLQLRRNLIHARIVCESNILMQKDPTSMEVNKLVEVFCKAC